MEQFREKLKLQNIFLTVCCVILAAFCVLGIAAELGAVNLTPMAGDSHWQSRWRGFISGASFGILGLMLYGLVTNLMAMKDGKKLKKLYIKTHDERDAMLFHNARSAAMSVFLILGLVAVIVSGYFNITVSLTLLACVLFCSILCVCFKLYYNKKF